MYVGWNLYNNVTIKPADGTWDNLDNLLDGYCHFANMQVVDEKSFCRRWKNVSKKRRQNGFHSFRWNIQYCILSGLHKEIVSLILFFILYLKSI